MHYDKEYQRLANDLEVRYARPDDKREIVFHQRLERFAVGIFFGTLGGCLFFVVLAVIASF